MTETDPPVDPQDLLARMRAERLAKAREKRAARREAVKALGTPPPCRNCGRQLRPYQYFQSEHARGRKWGYMGDGFFCTLGCGHAFGCRAVMAGYVRREGGVS